MRLNWNSFALEEGGYECPYDHVSVYDNSTRWGRAMSGWILNISYGVTHLLGKSLPWTVPDKMNCF